MRISAWLVLAFALLGLGASHARATSLYFEASPTPARRFCEEPCFFVSAFLQDPTRQVDFQALQFDVDIGGSASGRYFCAPAIDAPCPGAPPNAAIEDDRGNLAVVPWNLSATIGTSPTPGFEFLYVLAADVPFDVESVQALHDKSVGCMSATSCALQRAALERNRIYLGQFLVHWDAGGPATLRVAGISGVALPEDLDRLNGSSCSLEAGGGCHLPEPAPLALLLGLAPALAARGMLARTCRRAAGPEGSRG